jgi:hypothetical protein
METCEGNAGNWDTSLGSRQSNLNVADEVFITENDAQSLCTIVGLRKWRGRYNVRVNVYTLLDF